jgi:succinate dehydrogenase / fumarate reductase flavoprotein subunit
MTDNEVWGRKNLVVTLNDRGDGVELGEKPLPEMPEELRKYFDPATASAQGSDKR